MSIDRNVGSLNSYLGHITTSKGYNRLRYKAYNSLKRHNLISEKLRGKVLRFNNSLKSLLSSKQNIFEGLNVRYFGPFDGHDLNRIIKVLREVKDMEGPRIIHLCTVKGKGYQPAEDDPAAWHAPGKFNPKTGERRVTEDANSPLKYQDVFGETLVELSEQNKNIIGITAAMLSGTSVSKMQKAFPERTFDVGISEGHAVTFAGGLAKDGKRPVVAIYSSFLQRAYDHIIHDVALQGLPVLFAIDRAGLVGEDGATHHGAYDLSYLSHIPGMTIASPRNEIYLRHLMRTALSESVSTPWAIRYPRGNGSILDWQQPMKALPVGKGEQLSDGTDVAILTIGPIASEATAAIERASAEGISVAHYDMIFLKPIDESILRKVAESGMAIITVEDASIKGGLGSAVIEWLSDNGFSNKVTRIGIPDQFVPQGSISQLRRLAQMDAEAIYTAIKNSQS